MAEDTPAAAPAATNGDASAAAKPERKHREREPDVPLEELGFDLTKPIPRVERPNKDEHEKELQALTDQMDSLKAERQKIQEKIDLSMSDPAEKAAMQETRTKLNALKTTKNALIEEKKRMRAEMDVARGQTDKLISVKKDVKSNVKFTKLEDIEKEIKKLKRQQETTSMTLQEEKKLIKEMDALAASKKFVADLTATDSSLDGIKEQRKSIQDRIKMKDAEIDVVSKEIDEIMTTLRAANEKDTTKREAIQSLFQERDAFKAKMGAIIKEKDAMRAEFREKNNAWYNNQRAVRAQKKLQYEEESKARAEEKAAYLAEKEAEEAKKIPYEEEQHLCEYLAEYLERTYLSDGKTEKKEAGVKDVVAVKEDPFAGMMPTKKSDDEIFFGKGKAKKKRVRQAKATAAGPFTLSVDSFEQFGLLQLSPPVNVGQVADSVKQLREKKEWYKQQPRGSVPTASEIRKAGEKQAQKLRQSVEVKPKSVKGSFSLQKDEFVPLGAGGTTSVNSSWGQKASEEEYTPEE